MAPGEAPARPDEAGDRHGGMRVVNLLLTGFAVTCLLAAALGSVLH
jgi:hypothetical protein